MSVNQIKDTSHKNSNGLSNGLTNGHKVAREKRTSWNIKMSDFSKRTTNQVRYVIELLKLTPNKEKQMISLTIGDPTIFGNLRSAPETIKAMLASVQSEKNNGYAHLHGQEAARKAIAEYSSFQSETPISPDNIFITNGCASALDFCFAALADKGKNILAPRPGFNLYETHANGYQIEIRHYNLLPEKDWEIDLVHMESLIDDNTVAVLINNPNNPCGNVFSKNHLEDIIAICERNFVPIIADEIYEQMVFPGTKYTAISRLSRNVPVLTCSGLTKRFLVPGWRMGWIVVHDRENRLSEIMTGIRNMSGRVLGASNLVQGALPDILKNTPQHFFDSVMDVISKNAKLSFDMISKIPGLKPTMPSGTLYMMIGVDFNHFPEFEDDVKFVENLVNEQSVFCLPGSCFKYPKYVRIVLTIPEKMIREACERIAEFCENHYK